MIKNNKIFLGIILCLLILIVILLQQINNFNASQNYHEEKIRKLYETNNILMSEQDIFNNDVDLLEAEIMSLNGQLDLLKDKISYDATVFNTVMSYLFIEQTTTPINTVSKPIYVDSKQVTMADEDKYRILKKDSILQLSPSPIGFAISKTPYNYIVEVTEKRIIKLGNYENNWYHINVMFMNTEADKGWVPEQLLFEYDETTQDEPVNVRTVDRAVVYLTNDYDRIRSMSGQVINYIISGRIVEIRDEYVLVFSTDDTFLWVKEDDLLKLDVEEKINIK